MPKPKSSIRPSCQARCEPAGRAGVELPTAAPPGAGATAHPASCPRLARPSPTPTAAFRVLETTHPPTYYLPPERLHCPAALIARPPAPRSASGKAAPATATVRHAAAASADDAAWSYPDPAPAFRPPAGPCGRVRRLPMDVLHRRRRARHPAARRLLRRLGHRQPGSAPSRVRAVGPSSGSGVTRRMRGWRGRRSTCGAGKRVGVGHGRSTPSGRPCPPAGRACRRAPPASTTTLPLTPSSTFVQPDRPGR